MYKRGVRTCAMKGDRYMYPYCGFCKHAIHRRVWEEKINYGNGTYDSVYCEEIECELNNTKYHPMEFGCDDKNFCGKER